ncbi:MAG: hypothetical protein AVDCRST_MAG05-3708, partial [uncultured Rubrobacteraceae bacterium]
EPHPRHRRGRPDRGLRRPRSPELGLGGRR